MHSSCVGDVFNVAFCKESNFVFLYYNSVRAWTVYFLIKTLLKYGISVQWLFWNGLFFVKTKLSYFLSRSLRVDSLLETQTLWHLQHWCKILIPKAFLCWNHPWSFSLQLLMYAPCSYHTGECCFWNGVCQNCLVVPETSHALSSVHQTSLAFLFIHLFPRVGRVFASPPWSQTN